MSEKRRHFSPVEKAGILKRRLSGIIASATLRPEKIQLKIRMGPSSFWPLH